MRVEDVQQVPDLALCRTIGLFEAYVETRSTFLILHLHVLSLTLFWQQTPAAGLGALILIGSSIVPSQRHVRMQSVQQNRRRTCTVVLNSTKQATRHHHHTPRSPIL